MALVIKCISHKQAGVLLGENLAGIALSHPHELSANQQRQADLFILWRLDTTVRLSGSFLHQGMRYLLLRVYSPRQARKVPLLRRWSRLVWLSISPFHA